VEVERIWNRGVFEPPRPFNRLGLPSHVTFILDLGLELGCLVEIERWILSWGADAEVLKPRELAEAVRKAAQAVLKQRR